MNALELNALGFEGDTFLKAEFERLVKKHGVISIIETGTYLGATTVQFAKMVQRVDTVEINEEYFLKAQDKFVDYNIHSHNGNSIDFLPISLSVLNNFSGDKILCFLDAHWQSYNPLLQELEIIAQSGVKPIIVIHDFKVPNHPELGFDSYGGQDYEWSWIEPSIENIYGKDGYTYHYNSEAIGAKRGVIFIEPK